MVNPAAVHGRCLAMMVWGKKADGTNDVAVFTGTAEWDGQRLVMLRGHGEPPLEVQGEWLDRLKPTAMDSLWTSRPTYRVLLDSSTADLLARYVPRAPGGSGPQRLTRVERWGSASPRGSHTV